MKGCEINGGCTPRDTFASTSTTNERWKISYGAAEPKTVAQPKKVAHSKTVAQPKAFVPHLNERHPYGPHFGQILKNI